MSHPGERRGKGAGGARDPSVLSLNRKRWDARLPPSAKAGYQPIDKALERLKHMGRKTVEPNVVTYRTIINACAVKGELGKCYRIFC